MTLVVHHYYPLGSDNIGDHLVALAIRTAIRTHFGPAQFVDMPVNDRYRGGDRPIGLLGENVDRSNGEADLIVVGGSNLLEPRRSSRRSSGQPWEWGVFTDLPSIGRLRRPVLLIGMGTGSDFARRIPPYGALAATQIRALFGKAFAASVRDDETVARLAQIGVTTICTGCPVTFLTADAIEAVPDCAGPLLVSLPPGRILHKLAGRTLGRLLMTHASRYASWLNSRGVPIVVSLHEPGDAAIAREWLPAGTRCVEPHEVGAMVELVRASRGVIGFRLHAALLGLGLGRPTIPVAIDWRGRAFIETFGLDDVAVSPLRLGTFRRLRRLTMALLAGDPRLIGRLAAAKQEFQTRHQTFMAAAATRFSELAPQR